MSENSDQRYRELVRWAYLGEEFGAAFLADLIAADAHPDHRPDLLSLYQLEESTRRRLAGHLDLATVDTHRIRQRSAAYDFAQTIVGESWAGFMHETTRIAREALPQFEQLLALAPSEATVDMQVVFDHEHTLLAFAEHQLSGRGDGGILASHLHTYGAGVTGPGTA